MDVPDDRLEEGGNGGLLVVLGPDQDGPEAALQLPVRLEQQLGLQGEVERALELLVRDVGISRQLGQNLTIEQKYSKRYRPRKTAKVLGNHTHVTNGSRFGSNSGAYSFLQ